MKIGRCENFPFYCIYFNILNPSPLSLFHFIGTIIWLCDFPQVSGRAADRRQKCIPRGFSLKVRQEYDAQRIVLCSLAGLLPEVLVELQDCSKCGRVNFMGVVIQFLAFLRQPCNKAQDYCRVITLQSCSICGRNIHKCESLP